MDVARNIQARRKLEELYARGIEVRFGHGPDGEPHGRVGPFDCTADRDEVVMWVQPPSPLQREMAIRDAQAARARALLRVAREPDSQEHLAAMVFVADMDDATLHDYIIMSSEDTRRNEAVREVLARKEWEDITSLQDAMRLAEEAGSDPADPEYAALLEADRRYGDQVRERVRELTEAARESLAMLGRDKLDQRALDQRKGLIGSQVFIEEYERQMTFYAVRDGEDHGVLFFSSAKELMEQDDRVREVIAEALKTFISDGAEAKNSPEAVSGSDSSAPPLEPEISEVSIPETVNV